MRLTALTFLAAGLLVGCGTSPTQLTSNFPSQAPMASAMAMTATGSAIVNPARHTVRPPLPRDLAEGFASWLAASGLHLTGDEYTAAFLAARAAYDVSLAAGAADQAARDAATRAFTSFVASL